MTKVSSREQLIDIIQERINKYGNNCDLNDLDISLVTHLNYLFYFVSVLYLVLDFLTLS